MFSLRNESYLLGHLIWSSEILLNNLGMAFLVLNVRFEKLPCFFLSLVQFQIQVMCLYKCVSREYKTEL